MTFAHGTDRLVAVAQSISITEDPENGKVLAATVWCAPGWNRRVTSTRGPRVDRLPDGQKKGRQGDPKSKGPTVR